MEIRHAGSEDAPAISGIAKQSWEADYPDILHRENVEDVVTEWYDEDRIRDEIRNEDAIVVVAEDGGDIVGFAHGIWARRTGHMLRVYVAPDHRGQGIGGTLLATLRDSLLKRGSDHIQAMVLAENEPGNEFYRQAGFEKVDEGETTIGGEAYTENVYRRQP